MARVAGASVAGWEPVDSGGYGRVNGHWRVHFADGSTAFVKQALTEEAAAWLRRERLVYESVRAPFMPGYLGTHDEGGTTLLVIDDLSAADWPPPWSEERIEAVLAALETLRAVQTPDGVDPLAGMRESVVGWPHVAADPRPLLATGICSPSWLESALPGLMRAGEEAELDGSELLHLDVRSDNLCFVDGRAVLVDWNLACRGNGAFDIAFWLPSLTLEGGPEPWEVLPGAGALAAAVAGFFASRAGLPPPAGAPTVRAFQRAQAEVALPWAARELGLEAPR